MEELTAEEAAEAAEKQTKKNKKAKKAKSKQARATAGGRDDGDAKGGGGAAAAAAGAAAAATTAARLSVAALMTATSGLAIYGNEEEKAQEKKEWDCQSDEALPVSTAPMATPLPLSSPWAHDDQEEEEEEDDEEAFLIFVLENAPLAYSCPIGICLLTDPIDAADGHLPARRAGEVDRARPAGSSSSPSPRQ
jgi:hypothetical protein